MQVLRYRWEGSPEEAPGVGHILGGHPDRARHAYRILCVLGARPGERDGVPCLRMRLAVERVSLDEARREHASGNGVFALRWGR